MNGAFLFVGHRELAQTIYLLSFAGEERATGNRAPKARRTTVLCEGEDLLSLRKPE
jgi:hypothetical protein